VCEVGFVVRSLTGIFSLESDDDDEGAILGGIIVAVVPGVLGCEEEDKNEKPPSTLIGVVPTSSQSASLALFLNKSDKDGFLFPFLSLLAESKVAAGGGDCGGCGGCGCDGDEVKIFLLCNHCFTPGNVIGNFDTFPLCEDGGEGATSMYSPCEFEDVIMSEELLGPLLPTPFGLVMRRESDAWCDSFLSLRGSGVGAGVL
jgi:hypothetical protein